MSKNTQKTERYIRNTIFGVEDSLVSTVGLISGIAAAGVDQKTILLTGIVLIFVEAFSMGAGSLLSDNSVEEFETHREMPIKDTFGSAFVMFISYFLSGFIPILPYLVTDIEGAFYTSIFASLIGLILLGGISGKYFGVNIIHNSLKMFVIGGVAILIGIIAGMLIQ